jgi:hypothetical protein
MDFKYETPKKSKNNEEDKDDLTKQAQALCTDGEEYGLVSKMNYKNLKVFVNQKTFERDQNLRATVFEGIHRLYAFFLDKIAHANGFVQQQIMEDQNLRKSIEDECIPLVAFLNNKAKIAFLTCNGVIQGKMTQRQMEPQIAETNDDTINEHYDESAHVVGAAEDCGHHRIEEERDNDFDLG